MLRSLVLVWKIPNGKKIIDRECEHSSFSQSFYIVLFSVAFQWNIAFVVSKNKIKISLTLFSLLALGGIASTMARSPVYGESCSRPLRASSIVYLLLGRSCLLQYGQPDWLVKKTTCSWKDCSEIESRQGHSGRVSSLSSSDVVLCCVSFKGIKHPSVV